MGAAARMGNILEDAKRHEREAAAAAYGRAVTGDFRHADAATLLRTPRDWADYEMGRRVQNAMDREAARRAESRAALDAEAVRIADRVSAIMEGPSDIEEHIAARQQPASPAPLPVVGLVLVFGLPLGLLVWWLWLGPLAVDLWLSVAHGLARLIQWGGGIVGGWL